MKKFMVIMIVFLAATLVGIGITTVSYAEPVGISQKCEGPQEMCDQIIQLKKQVKDTKQDNKSTDEKFVGIMASIAIALKILVSIVKKWSGEFLETEKGKMYLHIGIIVASVVIFLTTNMGMGLTFWQSLLLALGGPLASYTHEVQKTVKKLRASSKGNKNVG